MRNRRVQRSQTVPRSLRHVATPEAQSRPHWVALVEWATAIVPPVTVLTALAVWYGYELILARGRFFGLDPSVLGFGTRDYLFRTASAVLAPLLYFLLTCLVLMWLHACVRWARGRPELTLTVRIVAVAGVAAGVLLVLEGVRVIANSQVLAGIPVLRTLVLAAGLVLVTYCGSALRPSTVPPPSSQSQPWPRGGVVLVGLVVLSSVFWSFSVAAERAGTRDSYRLYKHQFQTLPRVVVYSSTALAIEGPGVDEEAVPGPSGAAYHWRYTGLRLLVRSGGNYFLIPTGWASRDHPVFVLRDEPGLRFEFEEPEEL
jgi:hypothetical protein